MKRELERVTEISSPRIRPVVESISELEESFEGDEAIIKESTGSSIARFVGGKWITQSSSLDGLKVESGSDGIPLLRVTIGGKKYKLPFVEET